jgi:hypothetical protein
MTSTLVSALRFAALSAVLCLAPWAHAADLQVRVVTDNSASNPGPFSTGAATTFDLQWTVGGAMAMVGGFPTWTGGADTLQILVTDANLGSFTIEAQDGTWRQMRTSKDFITGGWGGSVAGSSIAPFSVSNPARSTTPYVLTSISFDFRGPDLFGSSPSVLAGPLEIDDFDYLSLTLGFENTGTVAPLSRTTIVLGSPFNVASVSAVPEPATLALYIAGLAAVVSVARRRHPAA